MLVFVERGEPEFPQKSLSKQSREPANSVHIWRQVRESSPGHIGGKRVLSPLRQPCSPAWTWFEPMTFAISLHFLICRSLMDLGKGSGTRLSLNLIRTHDLCHKSIFLHMAVIGGSRKGVWTRLCLNLIRIHDLCHKSTFLHMPVSGGSRKGVRDPGFPLPSLILDWNWKRQKVEKPAEPSQLETCRLRRENKTNAMCAHSRKVYGKVIRCMHLSDSGISKLKFSQF